MSRRLVDIFPTSPTNDKNTKISTLRRLDDIETNARIHASIVTFNALRSPLATFPASSRLQRHPRGISSRTLVLTAFRTGERKADEGRDGTAPLALTQR